MVQVKWMFLLSDELRSSEEIHSYDSRGHWEHQNDSRWGVGFHFHIHHSSQCIRRRRDFQCISGKTHDLAAVFTGTLWLLWHTVLNDNRSSGTDQLSKYCTPLKWNRFAVSIFVEIQNKYHRYLQTATAWYLRKAVQTVWGNAVIYKKYTQSVENCTVCNLKMINSIKVEIMLHCCQFIRPSFFSTLFTVASSFASSLHQPARLDKMNATVPTGASEG